MVAVVSCREVAKEEAACFELHCLEVGTSW